MCVCVCVCVQDSTLKCWEWERGRLLDTVLCSKLATRPHPATVAATAIPSEDSSGCSDRTGREVLTQLCCTRSCDADGRSKVIVAMEA